MTRRNAVAARWNAVVTRLGGDGRVRDAGSASIWLLGIGLAVVTLAALSAVAGQVLVTRHRARVAADLAALAGASRAAEGATVACERAGMVAAEAPARLLMCRLDGLDLTVTVAVAGPAGVRAVAATARAGPVRRAPP